MRKLLVGIVAVAVAATVVVPSVHAQAQLGPGWNFIVRGGWTINTLGAGGGLVGDQTLNGVALQGTFEYDIHSDFSMEFGLGYVEKGGAGSIDDSFSEDFPAFSTVDGELRLKYIEFSFIAVGKLNPSNASQFRLYLGGALAGLGAATFNGTVDGQPASGDIKDDLNNADFAAIMGVGFAYRFHKVQLLIDWRFEYGLANINPDQTQPGIKTRTHILSIGVGFPLGSHRG